MNKIVATADLHGALPDIPPCDIVVFAGDITGTGQAMEYRRFFRYANELPAEYVIMVAGNHDTMELYNPKYKSDKIITLLNQGIELNGLKIWGSPYSNPFNGWRFMPDDETRDDAYSEIPNDTDILITHGPEHMILDLLPQQGHVGDKVLAKHITRIRPKVHICGHIHEGYGYTNITGVHSYNVSYISGKFDRINEPVSIRLDDKKRVC